MEKIDNKKQLEKIEKEKDCWLRVKKDKNGKIITIIKEVVIE